MHFNNKLCLIASFQRGWFIYVLWRVYIGCHALFIKKIYEEELLDGALLKNPLQNLNNIICESDNIKWPGIPPSLLPQIFTNQQDEKDKHSKDEADAGGQIPKDRKWRSWIRKRFVNINIVKTWHTTKSSKPQSKTSLQRWERPAWAMFSKWCIKAWPRFWW